MKKIKRISKKLSRDIGRRDYVENEDLEFYPILYKRKEECCGCAACFSICPAHAIKMEVDEKGFLYPHIDYQECLRCTLCLRVCVF